MTDGVERAVRRQGLLGEQIREGLRLFLNYEVCFNVGSFVMNPGLYQ